MSGGKVVQVIGAVVDVEFSRDAMPKVFNALTVDETDIMLEVQQQLGDGVVRTIALGSTDGLKRGLNVTDTGTAISVPVGEQTLARSLGGIKIADQARHPGERRERPPSAGDWIRPGSGRCICGQVTPPFAAPRPGRPH